MSISDNVVSIGDVKQDKIARQVLWQKLQPEIQTITTKHMQQVMQGLFDIADDALFKMAENSPEGMDQSIYFDSMRIIRLQRNKIETRLFKELDKYFDKSINPPEKSTSESVSIDYDALELVSESDLEINLAVDNLMQKICNLYTTDINSAEKRFAWLQGKDKQEKREETVGDTPFGAEAIVKSFAKGAEEVELTLEVQLIMLKLFDMQCIHSLTGLYQDINQLFIDNNVLPVIKHEFVRQPSQGQAPTAQGQTTPGQPTLPSVDALTGQGMPNGYSAGGAASTSSSPMWGELQQLLNVQRQSGFIGGNAPATHGFEGIDPDIQAHRGSANVNPVMLSTKDVLASLSEMQAYSINELPEGGAHAVGNYLRVQLQTDPADGMTQKPINPVDNDLIDIVCLIFEYILEDPHLPSVAKASIGRLQIPMLKVAMIDKNFFSMNGHPARNLLNQLASSAVGIDESEGLDNPYLNKIHEIVEHVLNYFTDDLSLFDKLQAELDLFLEEQENEETEAHVDLLKHQQEKEEMVLARSWVKETLSQHLLGKELPVPIIDIILGPWKDVMLQTYLQEGEHSQLWQIQIRFIDVLCWSVEPKQDKLDKTKLGSIIQQLIKTLRHGLESIQYDQFEIVKIFNTLEPYHLASMHGRDLADCIMKPEQNLEQELSEESDTDNIDLAGAPNTEKVVLEDIVLEGWEQDSDLEQIDDEYLELARHLEMGNWVEFKDDKGNVRRAKLAWKSELLGEYTFLNWKFDVVADKSLIELAEDLRQGQAKVVDEVPLMDRALSAVVSNLIPKSN